MDYNKLFRVLVIGGAMLGVGCLEAAPPADDAGGGAADAGLADAALPAPDAELGDAGEGNECGFCPNELCCETDEAGSSTVREGMVCCWGTTC